MTSNKLSNNQGGVYGFTNENLREYMANFDLQDKDVLTVTASGDHAFNVAIQKPKSITCFDNNPLARRWMELKKAGILTLDYEKFVYTFIWALSRRVAQKKELLSQKKYKVIRDALDDNSKKFWDDHISEICGGFFQGLPFMTGFSDYPYGLEKHIAHTNAYMDEDKYKTLQTNLPNIEIDYTNSCFSELDDKQYDAVFTSNICDYLYNHNRVVEEKKWALVSPGGFMQTHVLQAHDGYIPTQPNGWQAKYIPVNNKDIRNCLFNKLDNTFVSIHREI